MAPRYNAPSRCSGASPIKFRWYGVPTCSEGCDLDTAVDALMDCISGADRVWNPYAKTMVRSEFRNRIRKAARGKLLPIDEVKPVDAKNPPPLYEIRWQGVSVTERIGGQLQFGEVVVRMYHSEPLSAPQHFVGHHVHEKDVSVADINAAQQIEIRKAIVMHDAGRSSKWGIAFNGL